MAGNDVLLFPGDPEAAIAEAMSALADGTLDSAAVTSKCRRVLLAKSWIHADEAIPAHGTDWEPTHADLIHRAILAQSLTVLPGTGAPQQGPSQDVLVTWPCSTWPTTKRPVRQCKRSCRTPRIVMGCGTPCFGQRRNGPAEE